MTGRSHVSLRGGSWFLGPMVVVVPWYYPRGLCVAYLCDDVGLILVHSVWQLAASSSMSPCYCFGLFCLFIYFCPILFPTFVSWFWLLLLLPCKHIGAVV